MDDLDTFLVTVYCTVDALYQAQFASHKPTRPGRTPALSDSEVLTLLVLAQGQPRGSERRFVRYVRRQWRSYFPQMLSQSAFNRRARDLAGVLCALGPAVADLVTAGWAGAGYEVVDGVPVPLARRCRGVRRRLFPPDVAGLGRGGSDRTWYFGVHLVAAVHPAGVVTGFLVGPPTTGERWLLEPLLRWRWSPTTPQPTAAELAPVLGPRHVRGGQRVGPTGRLRPRAGVGQPARGPYLADLGFAGATWQAHWHATYGATVLTKRDLPPTVLTPATRTRLVRCATRCRQVVETVFAVLTDRFHLAFPGARSVPGLLARLGAKIAALNLAVALNRTRRRPAFTTLDLLASCASRVH
jgi:hypothetical protein